MAADSQDSDYALEVLDAWADAISLNSHVPDEAKAKLTDMIEVSEKGGEIDFTAWHEEYAAELQQVPAPPPATLDDSLQGRIEFAKGVLHAASKKVGSDDQVPDLVDDQLKTWQGSCDTIASHVQNGVMTESDAWQQLQRIQNEFGDLLNNNDSQLAHFDGVKSIQFSDAPPANMEGPAPTADAALTESDSAQLDHALTVIDEWKQAAASGNLPAAATFKLAEIDNCFTQLMQGDDGEYKHDAMTHLTALSDSFDAWREEYATELQQVPAPPPATLDDSLQGRIEFAKGVLHAASKRVSSDDRVPDKVDDQLKVWQKSCDTIASHVESGVMTESDAWQQLQRIQNEFSDLLNNNDSQLAHFDGAKSIQFSDTPPANMEGPAPTADADLAESDSAQLDHAFTVIDEWKQAVASNDLPAAATFKLAEIDNCFTQLMQGDDGEYKHDAMTHLTALSDSFDAWREEYATELQQVPAPPPATLDDSLQGRIEFAKGVLHAASKRVGSDDRVPDKVDDQLKVWQKSCDTIASHVQSGVMTESDAWQQLQRIQNEFDGLLNNNDSQLAHFDGVKSIQLSDTPPANMDGPAPTASQDQDPVMQEDLEKKLDMLNKFAEKLQTTSDQKIPRSIKLQLEEITQRYEQLLDTGAITKHTTKAFKQDLQEWKQDLQKCQKNLANSQAKPSKYQKIKAAYKGHSGPKDKPSKFQKLRTKHKDCSGPKTAYKEKPERAKPPGP